MTFDTDLSAVMPHYRFYYECLMKPNARSVLTALRKCASEGADFVGICNGHGPLLRFNVDELVGGAGGPDCLLILHLYTFTSRSGPVSDCMFIVYLVVTEARHHPPPPGIIDYPASVWSSHLLLFHTIWGSHFTKELAAIVALWRRWFHDTAPFVTGPYSGATTRSGRRTRC